MVAMTMLEEHDTQFEERFDIGYRCITISFIDSLL
jgi:hypothetical protein